VKVIKGRLSSSILPVEAALRRHFSACLSHATSPRIACT
jgi:hypothetical protein